MGNRITNVESPQGFAAESSSAAVILASSYYGYPLVDDPGRVRRRAGLRARQEDRAAVHWNVIGQMLSAWVLTMPGAGVLGGVAWAIADLFGAHSNVGAIVIVPTRGARGVRALDPLQAKSRSRAADLDRTNVSPVEEAELAGVPPAIAAA